ncbi:translation initiation factor IF-3 [Guyparkeria halophila]|uniref:Translation initiation factor IF-3 n=1 Tax=Guyparkeria halophila TaxID=47960 RepID=A0ABZ0Z229_9GAMM|nr:translation initiation factor IF-3 [Guyparkeria halophila]WQH17420.1 translation initiation factor IF-3 [Guyparkeria halophila]
MAQQRGKGPAKSDDPRINDQITIREVRLVDENGEQVGVVDTDEARERAVTAGMDLVEVSPTAKPPVCKIMDFGKFKYQQSKKAAEAKKKQKHIEIKEVKFRPGTEDHDYQVKLRNATRFLEAGDKVKITLRFRGREMAHRDLGAELLSRIEEDLSNLATVEQKPRMEGRQATMVMAPRPTKT